MNAETLELYELLKPKLDEEAARRLVLALPSQPQDLVTKGYLDRKLAEQSDKLTWRMVTIMGAWMALGTSLFALLSKVVH